MEHKYTFCRRGAALTAAAAFGLATTAMLAPAAHADTEGPPEDSASTAMVRDVAEAAGAIGDEAADETGNEAVAATAEEIAVGTGGELPGDAAIAPVEAAEADATDVAGDPEQDGLCVDGAIEDGTGGQQAPVAGTAPAATDSDLTEGIDGQAGLSDAAPTGEGAVTNSGCAATTPGQAGEDPGVHDEDGTPLPVGGVDAGMGEAASQNMVLPVAAAGAAAAAVGLGAYTLVRRSRSGA